MSNRDMTWWAGPALRNSSGSVYYYQADQIGSTRSITDSSGTRCFDSDFTPFGEEKSYVSSCGTGYRFAGYERDSETGLNYAMNRYYNFRIGRFMTPDPSGLASASLDNPQSLNRYAYVLNNPLSGVDPLGLDDCAIDPLLINSGAIGICNLVFTAGLSDESEFHSGSATSSVDLNGTIEIDPSSMLNGGSLWGSVPSGILANSSNGSSAKSGSNSVFAGGPFLAICGDFWCDEHRNLGPPLPPEGRGIQDSSGIIFMGAGIAREAGAVGIEAAGDGASSGFQYLFRPASWLNQGQYWRIGFGRNGGLRVFRSVIFGWKKTWWTGGPL